MQIPRFATIAQVLRGTSTSTIVTPAGLTQGFGVDGSEVASGSIIEAVGAGAIVESDSNSNGRYIRFSSGFQYCWTEADVAATTFVDARSLTGQWTLPASFVGDDAYVWGGVGTNYTGGNGRSVFVHAFDQNRGASTLTFAIGTYDANFSSGDEARALLWAMGRWK